MNGSTLETMADAIREAKDFRNELTSAGWAERPNGDLVSPDGVVWAQTTYTMGEYTLTCSRRPRGYGVPEGTTHVRVTVAKAAAHPGMGRDLAMVLIDGLRQDPHLWPPMLWTEHSRLT